jgi:hypothetical protein
MNPQSLSCESLTDFSENLHLGYPHGNGFADGGNSLILGHLDQDAASIWKFDLVAGTKQRLSRSFTKDLEFDVAFDANFLVAIAGNTVWRMGLDRFDDIVPIFHAPEGGSLHPLPSITRQGDRMVCGLYFPNRYICLGIDPKTGENTLYFEKPWFANHFHFCPYDEEWIGFAHEGKAEEISDRVWGWHSSSAPEGRCLFDQKTSSVEQKLFVGHERWTFHDRSVLIVGYGVSPGTPRGIYEAFADGRDAVLISEGNRDFHLNVSQDGRWIVVDTTGPHDLPGRGWENADWISDILLIERSTGKRTFLARSRINTHPSHAHPVFSPDGRWIYFNETDSSRKSNRINRVAHPFL